MLGLVPAYLWEQSMPWPEDIAGELPEPHPEEPAQLRSDILDELSDHLQSSLEHEQLTEADAAAARKSVLSRFGNPATIACRLWWDAMWGRIMLQRVTLGFVALLSCCAIVATFLIWRAIENSQQATAALVAQVQKLAEREVSPTVPEDEWLKYVDWIPVTVKLEYENGEPVTDPEFTVMLSGQKLLGENSMTGQLNEHPDSNGRVDFGLVKPGTLQFNVTTPWGERCYRSLLARVGKPVEQTITCPRKPNPTETVVPQVKWPEDLRDQQLWVQLIVGDPSQRELNNDQWTAPYENRWSVIISPEGQIYRCWFDEEPKNAWESGGYGGNDQSNPSATTFSPEALEYFVLGSPVADLANIRGVTAAGAWVESSQMSNRYELKVSALTMPVRNAFSKANRGSLHAGLEEPIERIELPATGVQISKLRVLRKVDDPDNNLTVFQNVLPVFLMNDPPILLSSPDWSYKPSDRIVELVRKRLEQIAPPEKPEEESKTEAAEVSAELN